MTKSMIDFSLKDQKAGLLKISKHMDVVQEYKEELLNISNRWDNLVLLSHLDNNNTNINETKNNFSKLTTNLLYHLSNEIFEKTIREMNFKAQISIDILIRNLFERTADIGFLSTDENIRTFIKENKNKYTKEFSHNLENIKQRFKEYIEKYSVYYDIILTDTNGNILANLDEHNKVLTSKDSIINLTLNTNDDYIESFKYHDFLPNKEKSLVYGYKVKEDNSRYSQTIGALFLCFGFKNEMKSIFDNLVNPKNKECITILDKNGVVIASSDTNHIRLGTNLEFSFDEKKQLVSFAGRDYLSKTCKTKGYQGYMGQEWYGHIMIPVDYAFTQEENELDIDKNILLSILQYGQGFSNDMKKIPIVANDIQTNLNRLVWNGNINKNNSNINNKSFSRALLNEISQAGSSTKKIFDHSIANLTSTIVLNNTSYVASLMIDIMDRNLYERANDCRWWALTDEFKDILSSFSVNSENKDRLKSILQYINNLYTVYTNLFIYDKNGTIQACSNENENFIVGKQVNEEIVSKTKNLKNSNDYHVSNFEQSKFYDDKYTYIYHAKISKEDEFLGGIAIVFNSTQEFEMMLKESLPKYDKENDDKIFGVYTDRDKNIISTSNSKLQIGQVLDISDKFFTLRNGESYSEIIIYEGNYYALGVKCSQGYREYKKTDSYENDVFALYFSFISSANLLVKKDIELEEQIPLDNHENTKEIATFYIGGKWLGVDINEIYEAVSVEKLDSNLSVDDEHYFKGTVIYKNKAVIVLDIKGFIDEQNFQKYEEIVIIKNPDNSDNYIGILVNNLGEIPEIKEDKIKKIDSHILGSSTLINSVVIPDNSSKRNKILSLLDFSRLKENLVDKNRN